MKTTRVSRCPLEDRMEEEETMNYNRKICRVAAFVVTLFALAPTVYPPVLASPQTVEGVLSDSMCGKKHMLPGKTDGQCTAECVKANAKYALVAGDKVYTLSGPMSEFQKYVGQRVRVTGDAEKNAIAVSAIRIASGR